jgi:hypothetical protein
MKLYVRICSSGRLIDWLVIQRLDVIRQETRNIAGRPCPFVIPPTVTQSVYVKLWRGSWELRRSNKERLSDAPQSNSEITSSRLTISSTGYTPVSIWNDDEEEVERLFPLKQRFSLLLPPIK